MNSTYILSTFLIQFNMIKKIILFMLGIFMCSYSLMYMIIYLNLLLLDYSFIDYLKHIIKSYNFYSLFLGVLLLLFISLKKNKNSINIK